MHRLEQLLRIAAYSMVLAFVAFRGYGLVTQQVRPNPEVLARQLIGKHLDVPGADTGGSRVTAVLAMSTTCHFCTASAPFYQKLTHEIAAASTGNFKTIAVLPEEPKAAATYTTKTLNAKFDSVRQGKIEGAIATPTIFLLDKLGVVTHAWVGQLNDAGEKQVIAEVLKASGVPSR